MSTETIVIGLAVVAVLAIVALVLWRTRRARGRVEERERGEVEARVAERVHSLTYTSELAEPPERVQSPTAAVPTTPAEPEPAVEAPPRMVPLAAPDIDRVYAPRRPQRAEPAAASRPTAARESVGPDDRTRRRRRALVPIGAAVLVLAVAVLAGGPILRALVGSGAAATPTPTQLAVAPTATPGITPSPGETASPSPQPTPTPTVAPTATPTVPPGGTPLPTPHVYVVRSGDTLWQIAQTFDIALSLLIDANPQIQDPSVILPGEHVTIPTPTPAP